MRHPLFKNRALLASGLFTLLIGAIIAGCGGGSGNSPAKAGGTIGGGSGGGGTAVNNFTLSPARAAPGTLVTLQGVSLGAGDDVTVKFGAEEAVIHTRGANSTVMVPPFLNASNNAVAPGAPVAVTIRINGGASQTASGTFTVLPLPAAPNETRALAAQMTDLATALDNISTNLLAPLADSGGLDPTIAAHGAALAAGASYLASGADNPDSVAAILNGTAPVLEGKKLPTDLIGAMLAQADAGKDMEDFGAGLWAIEQQVVPEALQNTGTQNRLQSSSQNLYNIPENGTGNIAKLKKSQYNLLPNAKKIVLAIRFQKFLANYAEGLGNAKLLFNDTNDKIAEVLTTIAGKVPGPIGLGAKAIVTLYSSAKISGQVALGFAAFMPKGVSEFYIRLAGTKRGNGDPVYIKIRMQLSTRFSRRRSRASTRLTKPKPAWIRPGCRRRAPSPRRPARTPNSKLTTPNRT